MKARSMLEGGTYGPKTLKAVCQAFDECPTGLIPGVGTPPRPPRRFIVPRGASKGSNRVVVSS
jgi:hypothetical protein